MSSAGILSFIFTDELFSTKLPIIIHLYTLLLFLGYIALYPEKAGKPKNYEKTMKKYSEELASKFQLFCGALGPFTVGAVVGVPLAYQIGFWSFFIPMLVIIYVVWSHYMAYKMAVLANPEKFGEQRIEEHETTVSPMYALALEQCEDGVMDVVPKHHFSLGSGAEPARTSSDEPLTPDSVRASSPGPGNYSLIVDEQSQTGELNSKNVHRQ